MIPVKCHQCGSDIYYETAVFEEISKGHGFSSIRPFCSVTCAEAAQIFSVMEKGPIGPAKHDDTSPLE